MRGSKMNSGQVFLGLALAGCGALSASACGSEGQGVEFNNSSSSVETLELGTLTQAAIKQSRVDDLRDTLDLEGITPLAAAPSVSDELFDLGRLLAFDKVLSGNQNVSCMTCHHPDTGTGDLRSLPLGEGGQGLGQGRTGGRIIPRNAPGLFNLHTFDTMFWDSRVETDGSGELITPAGSQLTPAMRQTFEFGVVAAQAMFPVTSREEMRGDQGQPGNEIGALPNTDLTGIWEGLMLRLGAIPEYVTLFEAAYPGQSFGGMTFAHAANAIAGFEIRAFEFLDSPWERFVAGDDSALSQAQFQGAEAFFDSGCQSCHSGSAMSDFSHSNTGLAQFGPGKGAGLSGTDDIGREAVSGDSDDRYAFRVPPLSNVELTGPWGHDGQYGEMEDFIKHYGNSDQALSQYNIGQHVTETALYSLEEDNRQAVASSIHGAMPTSNPNHQKISDFMRALTDDAARDLSGVEPASVPSGLPVAD